MYDELFLTDQEKLGKIEQALLATYFKDYDSAYLQAEEGLHDIQANVFLRYNSALKHVVPWVARHLDLRGARLAEIGCGTGSSTAAFAHFVQDIVAYDIDEQAVAAGRHRFDIMGLDNASLKVVTPGTLVSSLRKDLARGVDIILLFAVLEHQTIEERHETINACWELLNPDGLLVVTETPNLLTYTDLHTSILPFLQLLPTQLYARYAKHSTRSRLVSDFDSSISLSMPELDTAITRWGRGVSYHDFELTLGKDYGSRLVATGFEDEILSWFEVTFEEELLRQYCMVKELDVPLAFTREVLNLIFKKGEKSSKITENIPKNNYISDMYTVSEQAIYINTLKKELLQARECIDELQQSKPCSVGKRCIGQLKKLKQFFPHF